VSINSALEPLDDDRVLPVPDWCKLIGVSLKTGRRLIKDRQVKITRLSPKRIGIRVRHHREFLDARASAK
jgi:hypothetical protein